MWSYDINTCLLLYKGCLLGCGACNNAEKCQTCTLENTYKESKDDRDTCNSKRRVLVL